MMVDGLGLEVRDNEETTISKQTQVEARVEHTIITIVHHNVQHELIL